MKSAKKRILVRLEGALSEKVKAHAKSEIRSMNSFINHAISCYIDSKEK